jgi:hypothetical protein
MQSIRDKFKDMCYKKYNDDLKGLVYNNTAVNTTLLFRNMGCKNLDEMPSYLKKEVKIKGNGTAIEC